MTTRKSRPHPAREARRTTGAVIGASTAALVAVMGVQSILNDTPTTSNDEGVSALSSNDGSSQLLFSDDDNGIVIERHARPGTSGLFSLQPSQPGRNALGSSHGS